MRAGTGYDIHRLVPGRPLVLAGVDIPSDRGPLGHSDGDVLCHALCDAILGAVGAGDLGTHFPDDDPRWKGAPGPELLRLCAEIAGRKGWTVRNADASVLLERPRIRPHVPAIVAALEAALGAPAGAVSVKARTNEGLDAVGRGEAIAAHAVVLLEPGPGAGA